MKKILASIATVLVLSIIAGLFFYGGFEADKKLRLISLSDTENKTQRDIENGTKVSGVQSLVAKVLPSIVSIHVIGSNGAAVGAGSIISRDGLIITNYHVVGDYLTKTLKHPKLIIELSDHTEVPGQIIGIDQTGDISVVKIDPRKVGHPLTPIVIGTSKGLQPGQQVITIGSPSFLNFSVGAGTLSRIDAPVVIKGDNGSPIMYLSLVTDAPVNHGNSGGALIDSNGFLIGIPSAGLPGKDSLSTGYGNCIPIDDALHIADELIAHGTVTKRGTIGLKFNRAALEITGGGVVLPEKGGSLYKAGIHDIITVTHYGGHVIENPIALLAADTEYFVGQKEELTYFNPRDPQGFDHQKTITVTVGRRRN